jgi:hypothetical protein
LFPPTINYLTPTERNLPFGQMGRFWYGSQVKISTQPQRKTIDLSSGKYYLGSKSIAFLSGRNARQ